MIPEIPHILKKGAGGDWFQNICMVGLQLKGGVIHFSLRGVLLKGFGKLTVAYPDFSCES
ncbi:MAG: hypothetical protein QGE94_05235 [Desulfobacterales bacterium]|jgi:hypothetical protein|nr:hypothetical protein [Desulfobacterales bacterium]